MGNRSLTGWFGLGLLLALPPLLVVTIPPLVDYPNHLARIAILHTLPAGSFAAEHYRVDTWLVPNLLFDGVMYVLAAVLPLETAGRLFVALTITLLVGGTVVLHRTLHGRASCWPLLSLLLLPGWPLLMGFMNYVAGIGLLLLATALWLRLAHRPWPLRLMAGVACALVLFFAHIVVLALFAAVVGGYELQAAASRLRAAGGRLQAVRDLLLAGLVFVPAAGLFLMRSPTGSLAATGGPIYNIPGKLAAFPAALTSGVLAVDAVTLALLLPLALLAVVALRLSLARRFALALVAAVLVFCLLPSGVPPTGFLDTRVPFALLLLAIAATDAVPRRPRLAALLAAVIAGLVVLRDTAVTWQWASFEPHVQAYRAAFRHLPPGSTLFVQHELARASLPTLETASVWRPTFANVRARLRGLLVHWMNTTRLAAPRHLGTIAVLEAGAFVPLTFAETGVQPVIMRKRWVEARLLQRDDKALLVADNAALARVVARFTAIAADGPAFLLLVAPGPMRLAPPVGVSEIGRGPSFRLFCLARCGSMAAIAGAGPAPLRSLP
jgi:hypothetical protein